MAAPASFRLFRTGLVASVIVSLGAGGHLAGGGILPDPIVLAALCALVLVPVAALARFRLRFPALAGVLGAGQAWLHWSFEAFAPVHGAPGPAAPGGHAGHVAQLLPDPDALNAAIPPQPAAAAWAMLAAHAAASLATALVIARGEEALRLMAAWLQPLVRLPETFILPPAISPSWPSDDAVIPTAPALRLPSRRGPPAAFTAG